MKRGDFPRTRAGHVTQCDDNKDHNGVKSVGMTTDMIPLSVRHQAGAIRRITTQHSL